MMKKKYYNKAKWIFHFALLFSTFDCSAQGRTYNWLLGYQSKSRMTFTDTSYSVINEIRTIPFRATEGNISDENGNLLMSSNGIFISDATGDTMQGGGD